MPRSLMTRVRAKVELVTRRRTRGLIQGRERSLFKGSGEDFDDLKFYQPGDPISDIDWKATARNGEPLIKQFSEQRVRSITIVADTSRGMAGRAADGTEKADAAVTAAGLVCFLAQQSQDLVGLVSGSAERPRDLPARSSRGHLELVLRTIWQSISPFAEHADSAWLLDRAFRVVRRSGLLVIITDEAHPGPEDGPALRKLTVRHDVIVIRVRDASPLAPEAPDSPVADVDVARDLDPSTRRDGSVIHDAAAYAARRRDDITTMLDRMNVDNVLSDGDDSMVTDLVDMLRRREHRVRH